MSPSLARSVEAAIQSRALMMHVSYANDRPCALHRLLCGVRYQSLRLIALPMLYRTNGDRFSFTTVKSDRTRFFLKTDGAVALLGEMFNLAISFCAAKDRRTGQ